MDAFEIVVTAHFERQLKKLARTNVEVVGEFETILPKTPHPKTGERNGRRWAISNQNEALPVPLRYRRSHCAPEGMCTQAREHLLRSRQQVPVIAEINFARRVLLIRGIMTHKDCTKGAWKP